jgi:hypothetical protein
MAGKEAQGVRPELKPQYNKKNSSMNFEGPTIIQSMQL